MTRVEKTLADNGHGHKVREVRLAFQEAMAHEFKQCVATRSGARCSATTASSRSKPDLGFEFFVLGDWRRGPRGRGPRPPCRRSGGSPRSTSP